MYFLTQGQVQRIGKMLRWYETQAKTNPANLDVTFDQKHPLFVLGKFELELDDDDNPIPIPTGQRGKFVIHKMQDDELVATDQFIDEVESRYGLEIDENNVEDIVLLAAWEPIGGRYVAFTSCNCSLGDPCTECYDEDLNRLLPDELLCTFEVEDTLPNHEDYPGSEFYEKFIGESVTLTYEPLPSDRWFGTIVFSEFDEYLVDFGDAGDCSFFTKGFFVEDGWNCNPPTFRGKLQETDWGPDGYQILWANITGV